MPKPRGDRPEFEIHRAVFSQPTGKLNPLAASFRAPVPVEVFKDSGKWKARTGADRIIRVAGAAENAWRMRYQVAELFLYQETEWMIDGVQNPLAANWWHLHETPELPSLCGDRYHRPGYHISLPELRAGMLRRSEDWKLCPTCVSLVNRQPMPGDQVRDHSEKGNRRVGMVVGIVPEEKKRTVFVQWREDDTTARIQSAALVLAFLEQL